MLRHIVRALFRTPVVATVAILSLAIGIGANTAIFSVFDEVLVRPLPVAHPERLVNLRTTSPQLGDPSCNQQGGCDEVFSVRPRDWSDSRRRRPADAGRARGWS